MPATHGGQPVRLKIPFADFKERIDAILVERENLGALTAGQPAQVRPQMHNFVLNWFRRIEAALRDDLEPASYAQSLQSNRYMAILEDRLPYEGLYRAMDDEMKLVAAQLQELLTALEPGPVTNKLGQSTIPGAENGRAPKAFICHGSEDKQRFVVEFAKQLRARGIDAWLDQWEIRAGDSLVQRIFEEGIRECDALIVVLSHNSIDRPWVQRELSTGVVKQIEQGTRLIPIVLDGVAVPESLKAIKWVKVADVESFGEALDEVVRTIFGVDSKPPIGDPPSYLSTTRIAGLDPVDGTVLQLFVRSALAADRDAPNEDVTRPEAEAAGIDMAAYELSIRALENAYLIECQRGLNNYRTPPVIKPAGFRRALPAVVSDLDNTRRSLIGLLVNEFSQGVDSPLLAERLGVPRRLVIVLLRELAASRLVLLSEWMPNGCTVATVSELLARELG